MYLSVVSFKNDTRQFADIYVRAIWSTNCVNEAKRQTGRRG
jgi:hypothetical protein